jgi:oxygen-independent coproporphyrinogen-3 oxidase
MARAVYIHIPYCSHRCSYCDFNTYAVREIPEARYRDALIAELDTAATSTQWQGARFDTVFFGGGTPSLFAAESIARILTAIRERFGVARGAEITLEANPGTLEGSAESKLAAFREAGVNRLSIGCQSFAERHLATLGRIHGGDDAVAAVHAARATGFDNVSCDLIFAVPGQTLADWNSDLERIIELAPEHVSTYGLTYEQGTPLTRSRDNGSVRVVPEETERAMYELSIETLTTKGYRHYEISNFARPERESRHNLGYWRWQDYLGVGAGAHGFCRSLPSESGTFGSRYSNVRQPEAYMAADARSRQATRETLDRSTAISEYLMLGLRTLDGIEAKDFAKTFDGDLAREVTALPAMVAGGFIAERDDRVALTNAGLLLADSVIARLAASVS